MLTERQLEIVLSVVYEYIQTGEPAGSRTISKKYLRGSSAATIRNEMADLEEMGYFYQPHTSAGRLPTSRAYRLYVDSIMQRRRTAPAETEKWAKDIRERKVGVESILSYVSELLGKATNCVGMAALSALDEVEIQRINFVRLGGSAVQLLLVLDAGLVHHTNIQLPCELSQDVLDDIARKISTVACGRPWSQVRGALATYVLQGLEDVWDTCREAVLQIDLLLNHKSSRLFLGGAQHILNLPDFQDISKIQAVLSLLEQENSIANMVERYSISQGVSVTIGDENSEEEMKDCSLVLLPSAGYGRRAVLGLIGPLRMDYEKSIAILEAIAENLDDSLVQ
ncbi:MAG: heat-inducible transcription repressor HrcA [Synergistaceae bacterium]|nr:heat-inducible transcription repressor HrcA [Synergistaceae bacterium]